MGDIHIHTVATVLIHHAHHTPRTHTQRLFHSGKSLTEEDHGPRDGQDDVGGEHGSVPHDVGDGGKGSPGEGGGSDVERQRLADAEDNEEGVHHRRDEERDGDAAQDGVEIVERIARRALVGTVGVLCFRGDRFRQHAAVLVARADEALGRVGAWVGDALGAAVAGALGALEGWRERRGGGGGGGGAGGGGWRIGRRMNEEGSDGDEGNKDDTNGQGRPLN